MLDGLQGSVPGSNTEHVQGEVSESDSGHLYVLTSCADPRTCSLVGSELVSPCIQSCEELPLRVARLSGDRGCSAD